MVARVPLIQAGVSSLTAVTQNLRVKHFPRADLHFLKPDNRKHFGKKVAHHCLDFIDSCMSLSEGSSLTYQ